jgi:hypothetical protein
MAAPNTEILSAAQRRELLAAFRQDRKSSIWPWIGAFAFLTVLPLILYALHATVSLPLTLGGLLTVAILYIMDQRASWKYSQTQLHRLCVMLRSRSPFRRITGARPGPITYEVVVAGNPDWFFLFRERSATTLDRILVDLGRLQS